jgi:hypothetical protein
MEDEYLKKRINEIEHQRIAMGYGIDDEMFMGEGRMRRKYSNRGCTNYDKKGKYWKTPNGHCISYEEHLKNLKRRKTGSKTKKVTSKSKKMSMSKKAKTSGKVPPALRMWNDFLIDYQGLHPKLNRKQLMMRAKKSGDYEHYKYIMGNKFRNKTVSKKPKAKTSVKKTRSVSKNYKNLASCNKALTALQKRYGLGGCEECSDYY